MRTTTYQGRLTHRETQTPVTGFIFLSRALQFFCEARNNNKVKKTITKATGPFVSIAKPKKIQANIQMFFFLLAILLQKRRRLTPTVPHNKESLTAVLLQIITRGDNANAIEATKAVSILALFF